MTPTTTPTPTPTPSLVKPALNKLNFTQQLFLEHSFETKPKGTGNDISKLMIHTDLAVLAFYGFMHADLARSHTKNSIPVTL